MYPDPPPQSEQDTYACSELCYIIGFIFPSALGLARIEAIFVK